jgi:uroporphyrinogen III methyltransferase/synthase
MRWFDRLPLFGKRIVVTRPAHQADETANAIRDRGAEPVVVPAIAIHPPPDLDALARSVSVLDSYDVVAFTSANGVDRTIDALAASRRDVRAFGRALVAAIGPGTEAALFRHGIVADIVAKEFRGEGLAASILEALRGRAPAAKKRVLLMRALVARDALPDALRAAGAEVDVTAVYETRPATPASIEKLRGDLSTGAIDVVTFTSSSTVTEFCRALGPDAAELLGRAVVAVIGPVTAETARELGVRVDVSAEPFTVAGLLDALERHFAARPSP